MKRMLNHTREQQTQGFQVLQNLVPTEKLLREKKILKHWQNGKTKETKFDSPD